jgi:competence protein ComEA
MPELPPRPHPPRSIGDQARAWLGWFGVARLVSAVVAFAAVVAGAWLLLRTPPPSAEATLPVASGAPPGSTLPPPTAAAPAPTADPARVVVHVAGAVAAPGVYEVPGAARVVDAIAAAGGAAPGAELDALNLAAPVADGQRVYVPVEGEAVVAAAGDPVAGEASPTGPLDLNAASAVELERLPGIGPATAAAIVSHREQHGPYATIDDLAEVRGIGPVKLDAIRDLVRV